MLLDTCSTANFVTEGFVRKLNLPTQPCSLPIGAINSTSTFARGIVQITFQSMYNNLKTTLSFLIVPQITNLTPSEPFPREHITLPQNIRLADPDFHIPRAIDLLVGATPTLSFFSVGQIHLNQDKTSLILQKTTLGWIITGSSFPLKDSIKQGCLLSDIGEQIEKFWLIEQGSSKTPRSQEEKLCERHFKDTVSRDHQGRYIVRLPFREASNSLGRSYSAALKRFQSLERKFKLNRNLEAEYTRVLQEYIQLGHMSPIDSCINEGYYIPHHAVIKNSSATTKVRVVFDASAKTDNGTSLNDLLMVGPTIQCKLFEHLIRFRVHTFVITADIEKMYRQVVLHPDDRKYHRILWRLNNELKTFELNTVTFGVASSPFLAIRTIHQLADDEAAEFPQAAEILKRDLYVDDLLTGTDTIDDALRLRDNIITLLRRGGFHIREWASNDQRLLQNINQTSINSNLLLGDDHTLKTLGISWNPTRDTIEYLVHSHESNRKFTKRNILSVIARIFDPLGLLGPVVLFAKRVMQELWRHQLDWDESVPATIHTMWSDFILQLDSLCNISFDRHIGISTQRPYELHGFCDASNVGYGACLYIRSIAENGLYQSKLLCAKSRVAPVKPTTTPRLELCGALILSRLYQEVKRAFIYPPNKVILWTDSTTVLHWLATPANLLNVYVANRVSEIQDNTIIGNWRYVPTNDNPADCLSRGQLPNTFVTNNLWFTGPPWLMNDDSTWPEKRLNSSQIPELRKTICLISTTPDSSFLNRFSSYNRLIRVIAYCIRFGSKQRISNSGPLRLEEIQESERRILKLMQNTYFARDIDNISKKTTINGSKLASLNPFLDSDGLLRVGGRLQNANLSFAQKHPILLPSHNPITDLIIKDRHLQLYHAGIQTTLYNIRQNFWLLDGRNQVRKVIRQCVRCFRCHPINQEHKMGNLPGVRVSAARPFANTGVDFCGPFFIKEKKYRNKTKIKVYVCVFICMAVKAVHLEIVSDLSTEGFLAAVRRLIARRGIVNHMYSDNGTNFVGANNQLKELYALFASDEHRNSVNQFAIQNKLTWHFNPPSAPHFGGLWEATVKTFKHHLIRVVGELLFTYEEFNTFIIEVEGILNSRPLTPVSSDPNDPLVLSPAHCLIGEGLTSLPESDYITSPSNRLKTWQHITQVRQHFWKRWTQEYLNELQKRQCWFKDEPNIKENTIVLIKDKNLPYLQWLLGRVIHTHPGEDGVVRAATIKTARGTLKRPVKTLCPLPMD